MNLGDINGACQDWRKASNLGYMEAFDLIKSECSFAPFNTAKDKTENKIPKSSNKISTTISPFLAIAVKEMTLKSEPNIESRTLLTIKAGTNLYALPENPSEGYIKIIEINTNKIGWVRKTSIKKVRDIPLGKTNSFKPSGTSYPSV
jgi:hypothetical protein